MRNSLPFPATPRRRLLAVLLAALTAGSCAVGPDYQQPPVAIPAASNARARVMAWDSAPLSRVRGSAGRTQRQVAPLGTSPR